jgi:transcriptional regulator with XRE-family HTH domain
MLGWSVRRLAKTSGISDSSIRRIESVFGVPDTVTLDLLDKLQKFFEGRGFKFAWDENDGPGVFWRRQVERRSGRDRRGSGGAEG